MKNLLHLDLANNQRIFSGKQRNLVVLTGLCAQRSAYCLKMHYVVLIGAFDRRNKYKFLFKCLFSQQVWLVPLSLKKANFDFFLYQVIQDLLIQARVNIDI